MKNFKLVTAVSIAALLSTASAFAQTQSGTEGLNMQASPPTIDSTARTDGTGNTSTAIENDIKEGWRDTKETVKNAADRTGNAITSAYKKIKASILNDDPRVEPAATTVYEEMTAKGMIGKPVRDQNNTRVATLSDIILDSEGAARMVVVKDSNFTGLGGKLVAFNYDAVIDRTPDGDIVMPISQKSIDAAAEFTYEASAEGNVRVIPQNGYSIDKLLDGKLLASDGSEELAEIDNVSFLNGRASLIIAVYDQILRMGGHRVAVDFRAASLVRDGDDINMRLSQIQTDKFRNLKDKSGGIWRLGSAY